MRVPTDSWDFLVRLAEHRQAFESRKEFISTIRKLVDELTMRPVTRNEAVERF
jgi:hypothetical protein